MKLDRNGDATWAQRRDKFEKEKKIYESVLLTFDGVNEADDVYNCSIPFMYQGKKYIFGRVEPHDKWATSRIYIFRETEQDVYSKIDNAISYRMEDPFIAMIGGGMIFGGVCVVKSKGNPVSYSTCFFKGDQPFELDYFTNGPKDMKDIRLVEMPDGIGVFSRPEGYVGFTVIKDINELDDEVITNAPVIDFIAEGGYGGVNQCYYLDSGYIGIIGHMVYPYTKADGSIERAYTNIAAVFDPVKRKTVMNKIIGTRTCYPASYRKRMHPTGYEIDDVAFTSGIVMRKDGKADLYSGLSDALEGRIVIDYPFEGYGEIVYGGNVLR